jgi:predicted small integral membrane protein
MPITRYAKIVMSACLAAFCLLVAFGNITDYGTNYLAVQHVLSMDTTFPGNRLMYRSFTSPVLWHLCYGLIIAAQAVAGILFLAGAIRLFQVRYAPGAAFDQAKSLVVGAALLAFLLWFFGFMVVAGEWFAMWQSQTWNFQQDAFRFAVIVLAVLIFVNQPDGDVAVAKPKKATAAKRPDRSPQRRRTDRGRRRTDTE